ncbi:MAG: hypothetical protein WCS96_14770, partial [Victivallales bacterium]
MSINSREGIIITKLDELVDKKYINEGKPNLWRAIPYRTESFEGVMLGEAGGASPLPLTIRLRKNGLYRIWLGVYRHMSGKPFQLRVRLSKDLCCQKIGPPE